MVATGVAAVQKPRGLEAEAARHLSHIQRAICLPPVTTRESGGLKQHWMLVL